MNYRTIVRYTSNDHVKAYVDVVVADSFAITGFKVTETKGGLVVLPPQWHTQGLVKDIWIPLNATTFNAVTDLILSDYKNGLS